MKLKHKRSKAVRSLALLLTMVLLTMGASYPCNTQVKEEADIRNVDMNQQLEVSAGVSPMLMRNITEYNLTLDIKKLNTITVGSAAPITYPILDTYTLDGMVDIEPLGISDDTYMMEEELEEAEDLTGELIHASTYDAPVSGRFKSWMSYDKKRHGKWGMRFSRSSNQYKLQLVAETGEYGIRTVDDRYCIAVGSYYSSTIGQYIDIEMSNGEILECIVGDQKADRDTDSTNRYHKSDKSIIEFIIDSTMLNNKAKKSGDISSANKKFSGSIKSITVYDYVAEF